MRIIFLFIMLALVSCNENNPSEVENKTDSSSSSAADTVKCEGCTTKPDSTDNKLTSPTQIPEKFNPAFLQSVKQFIPEGWFVTDSGAGKLNDDLFNDLILIIEKDSLFHEKYVQSDQGLIVLLGNKEPQYILHSLNLTILNSRNCCGMIDGQGMLSLNKGKIVYSYFPQRQNVTDFTFTFSNADNKLYLTRVADFYEDEDSSDSTIKTYEIGKIPMETYEID